MLTLFYKKVSELNGESVLKGVSLSDLKRRSEILIIDDEEFSYLDALRKHEYNITQKHDLTDLKDAEAYKIILCDIRGVGKFLKTDYEGAYLIKQLKVKYPGKTIIAYTANDYDATFEQYLDYADEKVPKGTYALEDWASLLDRLLMEMVNPVKLWEQTRRQLLDAGVSTIDVAKYESRYVSDVRKGEFDSLKKMCEKKSGKGEEIIISLLQAIKSIADLVKGG
ncbi:MAG: hypothetical protein IJN57_02940 [Oscillospiraceae bacterium]|nr:hypothetical protein [Oscillospiraceae bacterium]